MARVTHYPIYRSKGQTLAEGTVEAPLKAAQLVIPRYRLDEYIFVYVGIVDLFCCHSRVTVNKR